MEELKTTLELDGSGRETTPPSGEKGVSAGLNKKTESAVVDSFVSRYFTFLAFLISNLSYSITISSCPFSWKFR